jgi:hypothetical protein
MAVIQGSPSLVRTFGPPVAQGQGQWLQKTVLRLARQRKERVSQVPLAGAQSVTPPFAKAAHSHPSHLAFARPAQETEEI